jgi:hypothetical protein
VCMCCARPCAHVRARGARTGGRARTCVRARPQARARPRAARCARVPAPGEHGVRGVRAAYTPAADVLRQVDVHGNLLSERRESTLAAHTSEEESEVAHRRARARTEMRTHPRAGGLTVTHARTHRSVLMMMPHARTRTRACACVCHTCAHTHARTHAQIHADDAARTHARARAGHAHDAATDPARRGARPRAGTRVRACVRASVRVSVRGCVCVGMRVCDTGMPARACVFVRLRDCVRVSCAGAHVRARACGWFVQIMSFILRMGSAGLACPVEVAAKSPPNNR